MHLNPVTILFIIIIGMILWMFKMAFRSRLRKSISEEVTEDDTGFGYKIMWIAVSTEDKELLASQLGLRKIKNADWKTGIRAAYNKSTFITPPVKGWTMAVGIGLPAGDSVESIQKIKSLLEKLSEEYGEAQFFCTHRVVEYHCWIKAKSGIVERVYSYLGENGENIAVEGTPTPIEKKYNLINTFSPEANSDDYFDREDIIYPDEELVMEIAGSWSVDPTTIGKIADKEALGLLVK